MINKKVVNFFSQSKAGAYVNTRQFLVYTYLQKVEAESIYFAGKLVPLC